MADRPKTLLSAAADMLAGGTWSQSSNYGAPFGGPSVVVDRVVDTNGFGWASSNTPSFPEWLKVDLGSARQIDTWILWSGYSVSNDLIKDGAIQWSDDGAAWTNAVTFTNLFGATDPPTTYLRYVVVTHAAATHRYWRIKIDAKYTGGAFGFVSLNEVMAFDSATMGGDILAGATLTFHDASVGSKTNLTDANWSTAAYGWYQATGFGALDIDFGSSKYFGGFVALQYQNGDAYWPAYMDVQTSPSGAEGSWTTRETLSLGSGANNRLASVAFSRIYYGRYFRLVAHEVAGKSGTILIQEALIYATLNPAAPGAPSALVVTGDADDNAALQLRWSHAGASDDNLAADIDFEIQRAKDGGAYATIATVTSKYYVDSGLAAGSYTYKVRAVNRFHAEASAYTAASAAEVVPIAAAAAGGGPALQRGLAG